MGGKLGSFPQPSTPSQAEGFFDAWVLHLCGAWGKEGGRIEFVGKGMGSGMGS